MGVCGLVWAVVGCGFGCCLGCVVTWSSWFTSVVWVLFCCWFGFKLDWVIDWGRWFTCGLAGWLWLLVVLGVGVGFEVFGGLGGGGDATGVGFVILG